MNSKYFIDYLLFNVYDKRMETHEEIRQNILAAAEKLFLHYGYIIAGEHSSHS